MNSYGKKRKKRSSKSTLFTHDHDLEHDYAGSKITDDKKDVMVAGVIRISDKFELDEENSQAEWENSGECSGENKFGENSQRQKSEEEGNAG